MATTKNARARARDGQVTGSSGSKRATSTTTFRPATSPPPTARRWAPHRLDDAGTGGGEDDSSSSASRASVDELDPSSVPPGDEGRLRRRHPERDRREGLARQRGARRDGHRLRPHPRRRSSCSSARSWSLPLICFPPLFGVGCAYAFATATYGYVNTSGAFLGAIILGNGINYPIVLFSRYREFRARGMTPDVARRDAVWNAFRAELVGAASRASPTARSRSRGSAASASSG